jgi:hypothetical protein
MYAKVETCDWTGTFQTQVIGAHLSPTRGSDIKEVWVHVSDFLRHLCSCFGYGYGIWNSEAEVNEDVYVFCIRLWKGDFCRERVR